MMKKHHHSDAWSFELVRWACVLSLAVVFYTNHAPPSDQLPACSDEVPAADKSQRVLMNGHAIDRRCVDGMSMIHVVSLH